MKNNRIFSLLILWLCFFSLGLNAQDCDDSTVFERSDFVHLTVKQLAEKTTRKDKLVLVNFSATWCVVCKKQKPLLEELKVENGDEVEVITLDMECNPLIAEHFQIDALPTLQIYKEGYLAYDHKGLVTKNHLLTLLRQYKK